MKTKIAEIEALFRYPVKSMRGERLEGVELGWHGMDGDRRLAFRRLNDRGGFPWLTASRLPELIVYEPLRLEPSSANLPSHIRTPAGEHLALFGQELAAEVGSRHGSPLEMTHLNRGIFDEASLSVIACATVDEVGRMVEQSLDVRRFRPNVLLRTFRAVPYEEDEWVGGLLSFGEGDDAATVAVTNRDERCSMVCFDPDSAHMNAEVMRAIVRVRDNKAGVYATVTKRGRLEVGQPVYFTENR